MAINILDKHTANLIAAGEVVERPASAIKEMLENSADAGATRVTVEIKNGGTSYFRVTDNGCGMSADDLPKAILRHATSKISSSADLTSIGTYGFRGEALAAIAAVCDLRILTKRREDTFGSVLHICGGEILESGEAGCPDGTTIAASDIFKNIPARRKFLKKDVSEGNACLAVTEKFALSRPDVAVTLISDGNVKLKTSGDGILKNTIYSCLGKDFSARLLKLDYSYEGITIKGYIGKPETARPGRSMQNFFINGRYVRSGTICAALEEGFRAFCPAGRFPAAVIFCNLDFSRVDVNIHPAKTEVKFSEEKKVFEAVLFAVKSALNKGTSFPTHELSDENSIVFPENSKVPADKTETKSDNAKTIETPMHIQRDTISSSGVSASAVRTNDAISVSKSELARSIGIDIANLPKTSTETYKTADTEKVKTPASPSAFDIQESFKSDKTPCADIPVVDAKKTQVPDFRNAFAADSEGVTDSPGENDKLFVRTSLPTGGLDIYTPQKAIFFAEEEKKSGAEEQLTFDLPTEEIKKADFRVIGECFDSFILVERVDTLYIIDKHAAHERILYEEIKHCADESSSQLLLEPVRISLSTEEFAAIADNIEYFAATGFDIDFFGTSTILVRAFPEHIEPRDLSDVFTSIAAKLLEGNGHAAGDIFDKALFSAACKAAVKAGQRNTLFQDEYIAEKIFSSDAILYCPHGRPVISEFSKEKLYKMFKRT